VSYILTHATLAYSFYFALLLSRNYSNFFLLLSLML
jgi:hypothetical protein